MKPKILLKYETPEIDSRTGVFVEPHVARLFTVKMKLKTIGEKASAKVSPKVPALWVAAFQADKIVVILRIGSDQHMLGEFDVGSVADADRRRTIIAKLKDEGVVDASEATSFHRRHPDKARLAQLREAVAAKLKAIEALKNELVALKVELAGSGG